MRAELVWTDKSQELLFSWLKRVVSAFDQQGFIGAIIVALSYRTSRGLAQYRAAPVPTFRQTLRDRRINKENP